MQHIRVLNTGIRIAAASLGSTYMGRRVIEVRDTMSTARGRLFRYSILAILLVLCVPVVVSAASAKTSSTAQTSGTIISGFPVVQQAWALSCEYAATSAATADHGSTISQRTFLTAIGHDDNPHKGFRGSIYGSWGGTTDYGVYADPILSVLDDLASATRISSMAGRARCGPNSRRGTQLSCGSAAPGADRRASPR